MIDGLKLKMRGRDLRQRVAERIAYHDQQARRFEAELARTPKDHAPEHPLIPPAQCRREIGKHSLRSAGLALMLQYLAANEVYLLCEADLRSADLWPEEQAQSESRAQNT